MFGDIQREKALLSRTATEHTNQNRITQQKSTQTEQQQQTQNNNKPPKTMNMQTTKAAPQNKGGKNHHHHTGFGHENSENRANISCYITQQFYHVLFVQQQASRALVLWVVSGHPT